MSSLATALKRRCSTSNKRPRTQRRDALLSVMSVGDSFTAATRFVALLLWP